MFDKVIFKNLSGYGPLIDIGSMAEALVFYGHVFILANTATIRYLLENIPPRIFLQLMRSKKISLYYQIDQVTVQMIQRSDNLPLYNLVTISSPQHTVEKTPSEIFHSRTQDKVASSRFAKAVQPIDHDLFDQKAVFESFEDFAILEPAVSSLLYAVAPGYKQPDQIRFRVERESEGFVIDTNIEFEPLNTEYHKHVLVEVSSLSPATILSLFQTSQEELFFAGQLDSEVAVSAMSEHIQSSTIGTLLNKRFKSAEQIEAFTMMTLESAHAIREAVNSGKVPFADVVRLLDKADRFKEWLQNQPEDADVVKEYYRSVVEKSWVEKLPTKTTRWGIFTSAGIGLDMIGAGGLGTVLGVGLGAFDTFVLDKLIQGWRPHHFVETELRSVVLEPD